METKEVEETQIQKPEKRYLDIHTAAAIAGFSINRFLIMMRKNQMPVVQKGRISTILISDFKKMAFGKKYWLGNLSLKN